MAAQRLKLRRTAQKKAPKDTTLLLVSMIDIFTILVFFLMANLSEVEVLQISSNIKLPDSASKSRPKIELMVLVDHDDILVQGKKVARVSDLAASGTALVAGLRSELQEQASHIGPMPEAGYDITVMGDKTIPYWVLKKIMMTCQDADFAHISLAVNKIETPNPKPDAGVAVTQATGSVRGRS
jgi:biopolymer transport protein TolR